MGLIQVMNNLAVVEEVGHGIAVAFVATVYGVGLAARSLSGGRQILGKDRSNPADGRKPGMRRRRKHKEPENHERWLVSYADSITLLFAFFVVMFASSQTDHSKAQQVSDSVNKALGAQSFSAVVASLLGGTVSDKDQGNAQMRDQGDKTKSPNRISRLLSSCHRSRSCVKNSNRRSRAAGSRLA